MTIGNIIMIGSVFLWLVLDQKPVMLRRRITHVQRYASQNPCTCINGGFDGCIDIDGMSIKKARFLFSCVVKQENNHWIYHAEVV